MTDQTAQTLAQMADRNDWRSEPDADEPCLMCGKTWGEHRGPKCDYPFTERNFVSKPLYDVLAAAFTLGQQAPHLRQQITELPLEFHQPVQRDLNLPARLNVTYECFVKLADVLALLDAPLQTPPNEVGQQAQQEIEQDQEGARLGSSCLSASERATASENEAVSTSAPERKA